MIWNKIIPKDFDRHGNIAALLGIIAENRGLPISDNLHPYIDSLIVTFVNCEVEFNEIDAKDTYFYCFTFVPVQLY